VERSDDAARADRASRRPDAGAGIPRRSGTGMMAAVIRSNAPQFFQIAPRRNAARPAPSPAGPRARRSRGSTNTPAWPDASSTPGPAWRSRASLNSVSRRTTARPGSAQHNAAPPRFTPPRFARLSAGPTRLPQPSAAPQHSAPLSAPPCFPHRRRSRASGAPTSGDACGVVSGRRSGVRDPTSATPWGATSSVAGHRASRWQVHSGSEIAARWGRLW
jgi:hypothetical protein